jgi:hypothetical protein
MTDRISAAAPARRTRRQLLAGGTGVLAAVLGGVALARPVPAYAGIDCDVVLGQDNAEASLTSIKNTTDGDFALVGDATGKGIGVAGFGGGGGGVLGASDSGNGVTGTSPTGRGVYGQSGGTHSVFTAGIGVGGITADPNGFGVLGENASGGGVGVAGTAVGSVGVGVAGTAAGTFGVGVSGQGGSSGVGVQGLGGAVGVEGVSSQARGVGVLGQADSATAVGVLAASASGDVALSVAGKAVFSRSGVLTVPAGKSSATKTGVALTSASLVLATLQQDRAGVWLRSAVPNVKGRSFAVHLSKSVGRKTTVAWFVVN